MAIADPKRVILNYLCSPQIIVEDKPGAGGWRTQRSHGGLGADPGTVQFHKERRIHHRQLHAVTFANGLPFRLRYVIHVVQDDTGAWQVQGERGRQ